MESINKPRAEKFDKKRKVLEIKEANFKHNQEISDILYSFYPKQRKIPEAVLTEILTATDLQANTQLLCDHIGNKYESNFVKETTQKVPKNVEGSPKCIAYFRLSLMLSMNESRAKPFMYNLVSQLPSKKSVPNDPSDEKKFVCMDHMATLSTSAKISDELFIICDSIMMRPKQKWHIQSLRCKATTCHEISKKTAEQTVCDLISNIYSSILSSKEGRFQ
uniref:Uncharacterized protein n=1 Tax=Romanomermis culicivorax TaxID=13658 RepID=A0A915K6B5_ROMCU